MNSSSDFSLNGVLQEDPSPNAQISTSDSNANLSSTNQNKGAIPKTKVSKSSTASKKPTKLNNNIEEVLIPKSPTALTDDVLQMHSDVLRLNGFSDQLSRIPNNYLDEYNRMLYGNGGDNYENCRGISKSNSGLHENHFNRDIFNRKDENGTCEPPHKIPSYQPSPSSSKELDSDINLQLKIDSENSSSDDNELLSISDDGCIYTYKGDQAADLPSSFFSLEIPIQRSPEIVLPNREETTSPEMDFLEMDFDPGPSGDADSDSQSNADLENTENLPQDPAYNIAEANDPQIYPDKKVLVDSESIYYKIKTNVDVESVKDAPARSRIAEPLNISRPSIPDVNSSSPSTTTKQDSPLSSVTERMKKVRMPWSCSIAQRTRNKTSCFRSRPYHTSDDGELTAVCESTLSPCENCLTYDRVHQAEILITENVVIEKTMIWSENEARRRQITQIGTSACGATAVLNVLNALRFPLPSLEIIRDAVTTRLRSNSSPLTEYLLSRSVAGSTHEDIIEGLQKLSDGQIYARFFHMHPERIVNLYAWLQFWIMNGAVPIATLNLQKCSGTVPDAWHHQMIFGVGPRGIYLTNPLECLDASQLWPQLCSESILLIRREDVLLRWNTKTDLDALMKINDSRWSGINVVGQVANMVRESKTSGAAITSHIKIPAAYSSGITLAMKADAPLCPLLMYCPELPVLPPCDEAAGYSEAIF